MKNIGLSHYSGVISISKSMWIMNKVLVIPLIWGTLIFGPRALGLVCLSIFTAVISETLLLAAQKLKTNRLLELSNGSAVLCGFLYGLSLPVSAHWLIAVIGPAFAILVVKWGCGGFGKNWLNPALAGRLFTQLIWAEGFTVNNWGRNLLTETNWNVDAVSAASDLTQIKLYIAENSVGSVFRPLAFLERNFSSLDTFIVRFLNEQVLVPRGTILPEGYIDYLLGFRFGAIGETSIVLILLVSVILFARDIIAWQIPLGGFITMTSLSFLFSGMSRGAIPFSGDALFALCSGSFLFILMFMATDPVTSPYAAGGKFLFGCGFAALVFLLREVSYMPEPTTLALLIMNMLCPVINMVMSRRPVMKRAFNG